MSSVSKRTVIDWTGIKGLVEVRVEPIVCFKVIPDRTVTNYSNYKFFKDIHEIERVNNLKEIVKSLGEMTKNMIVRKDNVHKLVYRPASDFVWYEIVIKEKSINFYVLCSKPNEAFVKLKLEQCFPHAPVEVVDEAETHIPEENTIIADLKLQRHNFFSIRTDYTERAQPIEDVIMTAEDVREDDILKFSLRVQPFDQNYWSYKAEEWEQQTRKGKAPKRLRVTKNGLVGGLFSLSDYLFHKLGELFRSLHEVAFKKENTSQLVIEHASQLTREIGDISRQTSYKMTAPVFRTDIRIASHSTDETRRKMNMKSMSNSFIDLKDTNNSIVRVKVHEKPKDSGKIGKLNWKWVYEETSKHKITPMTYTDVDYTIMCDKELGKIQMLPTADVQKKFGDRMDNLGRKEIGIPKAFLQEDGIFIGKSTYKGEEFNVYLPDKNPDELPLPLIVSGIQGAGKDTFAVNYIVENALKGRGAVIPDVIDEKGRGMADAIISCLPPEKLMVLDFANEEYSPYLDWAEAVNTQSRFAQNKFASELVKFFEAEDEAGIQTERYLREAATALPNGAVIRMGIMFLSEELRERVIKECEERGDVSTAAFWKTFNEETDGRKRQIAAPILNRLHKLIGDPTLKPIFGQQPNGSINFHDALKEGKVIICKIPKVAFSTSGIRTLVHWLTVKTWLTKQVMAHSGEKCHTTLVLNEPHQYFNKGIISTLEEIFPESRKYGLQVMTLFHDFSQVPKDLADIMIASGANFVLLKQRSEKTWVRFKQRIEGDYTIEDCMNIKKWDAMIGFIADGVDQPVLHVRMNDMPYNRGVQTYDNTKFVEECLVRYGKPITQVEQEVQEDEKLMLSQGKKKVVKK